MVRRAAIQIGGKCATSGLANALLQVALDQSENSDLRSNAIAALQSCGDDAAKSQLKKWILGVDGASAPDDVRGEIAQLLWPGTLTTQELFSILTAPKQQHHIGTYQMFFQTLAEKMQLGDLPTALDLVRAVCWDSQ